MFADSAIQFFKNLEFKGKLPSGISIMNPFRENPQILPVVSEFYRKFYTDENPRYMILGINPGRFGAGITGINFTDGKRLAEKCGLPVTGLDTTETSSVFIYDMIDVYGGVERFYKKFYVSAVCPLGFVKMNDRGKNVNYNYYDSKKLTDAVKSFIIECLKEQFEFGINKDMCFCLGTGKNHRFLLEINSHLKFFDQIIPLEHPRYIMQYKLKQKDKYIKKYIDHFRIVS